MASIGGVTCDFVKGWATGQRQRIVTWVANGVNGTAAQKLGIEAGRFSFRGTEFDSEANIQTWKTSIEALKGTTVSIIDDRGRTHTNCFVEDVSEVEPIPVIESGTKKYRGEIQVMGHVRVT